MHFPRSSGILLHVTSLPSPYGIGDFGPSAYRFADRLAASHQRVWQILPLVPVGHGYSPYSSPSTFAGNPLLISPEVLLEQRWLHPDEVVDSPLFDNERVEFEQVIDYKRRLLIHAFDRFEATAAEPEHAAVHHFRETHAAWLEDYALFMALKEAHDGLAWTDWPQHLSHRAPAALHAAHHTHERAVRMHVFWQYLFDQQWNTLHAYCRARSILILGDLPIYVAHDSADVWANPYLFHLDDAGLPTVVAGVPPDYFSATGQRWGNPLYRWDRMQANQFSWWTQRIQRALSLYDLLRLDHFRGFAAYWEVPASEETAIHGRWVEAPGIALFEQIERTLGHLPLLAENLGVITSEVTALMHRFSFPGMVVLQFGFGGDVDSEYLPHNFVSHTVAYTGTHDNDTFASWWTGLENTKERAFARAYLGIGVDDEQAVHWHAIRLLMGSVAHLVVTPLQDVLGLGKEARMNTPGLETGNWAWRLQPDQFNDTHVSRLHALTQLFGRAESKQPPHSEEFIDG